MTTYASILTRANVTVPPELEAAATVPVLTGPQRQGDVGIWPMRPGHGQSQDRDDTLVPANGIAVVVGEATGNTHRLLSDGPVFFWPGGSDLLDLGTLVVPEGSVAWLIHDDEHGVNGIGAGAYRLTGKREQRQEIERVAD